MNPFKLSIEKLTNVFEQLEISTCEPGFCDHPMFLELERKNPELLNFYAAFVARRQYSANYLARAEKTIRSSAQLLHRELVAHGRLGACVDISGIFSKILDKEEIWNTCIKGSLTISFPPASGIQPRYFWSSDHGEFTAGHAWLFVPPFTVVDISAKQQPYEDKEFDYIPDLVLSKQNKVVEVYAEDIISPTARAEMIQHGIPPNGHLKCAAPYFPELFSAIPPIIIQGVKGATLKYSPVAIHAADCSLEDMRNMEFSGLTPGELYKQRLKAEIERDR